MLRLLPASRLASAALLGATLLGACAPAPARTAGSAAAGTPGLQVAAEVEADASAFRAAFSDLGVAWVAAGRACVARAPEYRVTCPKLPPVVDVAWDGLDVWAAVPSLAQVVTVDRAPRNVNVGRVVRLSAVAAYREDGSAVSYAGAARPGVLGAPSAALTGGDGVDYARVRGTLVRVPDGVLLRGAAGPYLVVTPGGAEAAEAPEVVTATGRYRLAGGVLDWRDGAGVVRARVPHGPGRVGRVGQEIVTVSAAGAVRRFTPDLSAELTR